MNELDKFSKEQETAVNRAAKKACQLMVLKPSWDMEAWFNRQKDTNPYFKGVSYKEFCAAVLGGTFKNS